MERKQRQSIRDAAWLGASAVSYEPVIGTRRARRPEVSYNTDSYFESMGIGRM